jgi:hypothetical protein
MTRIVKVEYDAEQQTLRLLEPLEGVADGAQVTAVLNDVIPAHPLAAVSGILDDEAGESFARAVEEFFPIEK